KMVRIRGNLTNNPSPEEGAATTQKIDEILTSLLETRDDLDLLEQNVMGNEEEEDADNNNQPLRRDNANVGVDNKN
ncbi:hypothetical protein KI387_016623, partial [Taxus chinensis]